jgi:hypothetical protein
MKKAVWVLNVNNYRPDICLHTLPTIKAYAERIGAEYSEITERKFPSYPVTMEKMQIYELGKEYDINILIDADVLISPKLEDLSSNVTRIPGLISVMQVFEIPRYFPYNYLFDRLPISKTLEGKPTKVGPSANFVITSKWSHFLWNPDVSIPELQDPFRIDEYIMSINLAKYGLNLQIFGNPVHPDIHHLAVTSKPAKDDIDNLLIVKKEFGII